MASLSYFIMQHLERKCNEMVIHKQIKGGYNFCKNIYTAQQYETPERKLKKKCSCIGRTCKGTCKTKPYKSSFKKKKHFIRKSMARKPYLSRDKHVRKFDKNQEYKEKITCYLYGQVGHIATNCPKRINMHNKTIRSNRKY